MFIFEKKVSPENVWKNQHRHKTYKKKKTQTLTHLFRSIELKNTKKKNVIKCVLVGRKETKKFQTIFLFYIVFISFGFKGNCFSCFVLFFYIYINTDGVFSLRVFI